VDATDIHSDPLAQLAAAEDAFQDARALLKEAEAERYASIWAALTTASDIGKLRAALPATVTANSLRAAVRRHASSDSHYIQPELFDADNGSEGFPTP
jgi:hypothetical protein